MKASPFAPFIMRIDDSGELQELITIYLEDGKVSSTNDLIYMMQKDDFDVDAFNVRANLLLLIRSGRVINGMDGFSLR